MKRIVRWLCPVLFLLICAGVIWSLHLFVEVKGHMEYITWDSSVQILSDGTEVPFETDTYSNISDTKGSYRFSGRLPEGLPAGSLFFETSGCSVTLSLNGTEIYRSSAAASQDAAMMSQATIPLPQGTTGTITMDYTVSDSYGAMFPPLLRFMPTFFTDIQSTAFANRAAQSDTHFDARAELPQELPMPEQDLCILLMNMLDNALEACGKITDKEQRHIQFRSEIKNDFLTISCKNTFSEKPKKDRHGRIITSKSDALSHGFGIRQMESIAQKYHSILDISYEMGGFFSVQTALRLPETKEHRNKPPEQPTRTAQNIS